MSSLPGHAVGMEEEMAINNNHVDRPGGRRKLGRPRKCRLEHVEEDLKVMKPENGEWPPKTEGNRESSFKRYSVTQESPPRS